MRVLIPSVSRTLGSLDTLAQHPQGLGVVAFAKRVGLNVSTTHHPLNTLRAEDYVGRVGKGCYCVGDAASRLYSAVVRTQQPDSRLQKVFDALVGVTQETSYLVAW